MKQKLNQKLILLSFAVLFGMTLTTAIEDSDFALPLFIVFCGLGFAYDRK